MLRKYRAVIVVVAIVLLGGLWYAFRPEKLFVNQKVNEAAPSGVGTDNGPALAYTGKFTTALHDTSGRASVYKAADGSLQLQLTDFATSNGPDVHVVLVAANDPVVSAKAPGISPQGPVELGALKGNQGNQNYDIPRGTDLNKNDTVLIYCERFHAPFGSAHLEAF